MFRWACLIAILLAICACLAFPQEYANTAFILDLGMGARPLALGEAFTGLADDGNALFYNSAGLAWLQDLSICSSYEARLGTASYGHLSTTLSHFGFGIHYFDFGEVPETDEFGNILGSFSYRNYAFIAALGTKAADVPFLSRMPFAEDIGFGLKAKILKISTLEPGSGTGFSLDLSFLFRSDSPSANIPVITGCGLGLVIENLIGSPIQYGSGHQEPWPKKATAGIAVELSDQVVLTMDATNDDCIGLGFEWTPIPAVSLRNGLKRKGVWMWSSGMGVRYRNFVFDFAVVVHPHLNNQFRGSLVVLW